MTLFNTQQNFSSYDDLMPTSNDYDSNSVQAEIQCNTENLKEFARKKYFTNVRADKLYNLKENNKFNVPKPLPINIKKNRRLLKRKITAEIQMNSYLKGFNKTSLLDAAVGSIPYVGPAAVFSKHTNKISDKLSNTLDNVNVFVSSINNMFTPYMQTFARASWVTDLRRLFMSMVNVYFAQPGKKITSFILNLTNFALDCGLDWSYFVKLFQAQTHSECGNMQTIHAQHQIGLKDFDILASNQLVAAGLVTILFSIGYKVTGKLFDIQKAIHFLGRLGKDLVGVRQLKDTLMLTSETVMEWFSNDILGNADVSSLNKVIADIGPWFDNVRNLIERTHGKNAMDTVLEDPHMILYVEELYKQGLQFSIEINNKKLSERTRFPFEQHMKLLTEVFKKAETSGAFGNKPRIAPIVIWLYGSSGVGKSGVTWPLAIDLNNLVLKDASEEERKNFSKNVYYRNVEQEFWDGYQGQNVVVYDDFGQMKDGTGSPNEEFFEIIRTANISPYPLHMAHLEEKRKTKFISKVCILSSNERNLNITSLTHPDAVNRRIDIKAEVCVLPDYAKTVFSSAAGGSVTRLDTEKVQKAFNVPVATQVYCFKMVDPETDNYTGELLNYHEFSQKCLLKLNERIFYSHNLNDYLESYAIRKNKDIHVPYPDCTKEMLVTVDANMGLDIEVSEILPKVDAEIQIGSEFYLLPKDFFIPRMAQKLTTFHIYDKNENLLDAELASSFMFATLDEFVDDLYSRYDEIYVRKDRIVEILERQKISFMTQCKEKVASLLRTITENPLTSVLTVLGAVLAGFALIGGWNWIFSDTEEKDRKGRKIIDTVNSEILESHDHLLVKKATLKDYALIKQYKDQGKDIQVEKIILEGNVSGDAVTRKPRVVKIEGNQSGDSKTLKPKIVKIEGNQSGDNITNKPKVIKIESNDQIDAEIQMWKDTTAQLLITNRILHNMYRIVGQRGNVTNELLNCLFIRGRIALVPRHLQSVLSLYDNLILTNCFDVKYTIPIKSLKFQTVTTARGAAKEAALMYVNSSYIHQHADIVKHFQTSYEMGKWKAADITMPTLRYCEPLKQFVPTYLGNTECKALDSEVRVEDSTKPGAINEIVLREGMCYSVNSRAGDCGSPIIVNETKVLRKISGIHNAGAADGMCYGESITKMDLERTLTRIPAEHQIMLDADMFNAALYDVDMSNEEEVKSYFEHVVPSSKFNPLGYCNNAPRDATKTELRPSVISGCLQEPTTKPAYLQPIKLNGKHFDIKKKNLAKAAMDTPFIPTEEVDVATIPVAAKLLKNKRPELSRILTFEEAVTGCDDSEFMEPINRSSSPGYPWINDREKGAKGKQQWLGNDEYIFNDEVRQKCEERVQLAKQGMRMPTIWVDTLKDERRPIEKVDVGKTRVFANGPMDYTIVFRQYFLGFMAHVMENRVLNEQSIGTNTWAMDWNRTVKHLQSKGKKVIAGDFSTFDGTLNSCIVGKLVDVINQFYDDGPENAMVRRVLFTEVYNSIHLCYDIFYMWTHSQPSGCPITTVLNSFYNSVSMRIVFNRLARNSDKTILHFIKKNRFKDFEGFASTVYKHTPHKLAFKNNNKFFYTRLNNGQQVLNIRTEPKECFDDLIQFCAGAKHTRFIAPELGCGLFKRKRSELDAVLDFVKKEHDVEIEICDNITFFDTNCINTFDKYCTMVSYGDDNVINISDLIIDWFNQQTITKGYETIGMIYTDEAKTGDLAPEYRMIEDVKYLKRNFSFNKERQVWDAPLDLGTIKEMINWVRGDLDKKYSTLENCSNAIRELSNHPREIFEDLVPRINAACLQECEEIPDQTTYDMYWEDRLIKYFI